MESIYWIAIVPLILFAITISVCCIYCIIVVPKAAKRLSDHLEKVKRREVDLEMNKFAAQGTDLPTAANTDRRGAAPNVVGRTVVTDGYLKLTSEATDDDIFF
eukprot:Trichotokara_eunicae@DN8516_c0_g1_i1.p2